MMVQLELRLRRKKNIGRWAGGEEVMLETGREGPIGSAIL